jgi:iron complex outermembrane receptor protein
LIAAWTVWPAAPARADAAQGHLTLDEIIVTEDAASEPMGTEVGAKKIEKGKNINIPDVLKNEPDIDIKRRTLIGDTADSLAIRGFSGNRIMLNIDGRPVNASGVVGGYYIDWGTIPLDNIEKIEIIRGGSSVRYGNNALGGVVNVITKKPTETPTATLFVSIPAGGGYTISIGPNFTAPPWMARPTSPIGFPAISV